LRAHQRCRHITATVHADLRSELLIDAPDEHRRHPVVDRPEHAHHRAGPSLEEGQRQAEHLVGNLHEIDLSVLARAQNDEPGAQTG
jgi:hypothetical protein